jgi:hypothetical protein
LSEPVGKLSRGHGQVRRRINALKSRTYQHWSCCSAAPIDLSEAWVIELDPINIVGVAQGVDGIWLGVPAAAVDLAVAWLVTDECHSLVGCIGANSWDLPVFA